MQQKGHLFLVCARDKEVSHQLLNSYQIPYVSRGKGSNNFVGKLFYMLKANFLIYQNAKKFQPDVFLSFASPYAAQVSWLLRKPHVTLDDTEHATFARIFYKPFTQYIFTPFCFTKNLGPKQIRFNSFMELNYLHPNKFKPNVSIYDLLKIPTSQPYVLIRFVSWNASHDFGHSGLNHITKIKLIEILETNYHIFISSETTLPPEFEKYRIKIPVDRMHDAMAFAALFVGEGATMASECAMMGTAAIYVNSLNAGTLMQQESLGLLYGFRNSDGVLEKINELLKMKNLEKIFADRRETMLKTVDNPEQILNEFFEKTFG